MLLALRRIDLFHRLPHLWRFLLACGLFQKRGRPACQDKANLAAKMAALPGRTHETGPADLFLFLP